MSRHFELLSLGCGGGWVVLSAAQEEGFRAGGAVSCGRGGFMRGVLLYRRGAFVRENGTFLWKGCFRADCALGDTVTQINKSNPRRPH